MEHREKAKVWLATLTDVSSGVSARLIAETGLKVLIAASDVEKLSSLDELKAHCESAHKAVVEALNIDLGALIEHARVEQMLAEEAAHSPALVPVHAFLLDVVTKCEALLASITSISTDLAPFRDSVLRQARAAIAKAEGRT